MRQETSEQAGSDARIEEMTRFGIICVPVDNFYYRQFHYTNLKDAVAQATRDKAQIAHSSIAAGPDRPAG
ncbi:hypothetical protein [Rhizomicrobium electricum]|uniref:Uncharacterized protein n=1 Tax=Rhizomicrobium electricum TaxID=480070 RepID=A0ABN1E8N9_9PROT|nr:hypothetical protein [Rhizomicrobium electricum]NIJ47951.1 hypothetical protein [Rhizomicrobium electricum]